MLKLISYFRNIVMCIEDFITVELSGGVQDLFQEEELSTLLVEKVCRTGAMCEAQEHFCCKLKPF